MGDDPKPEDLTSDTPTEEEPIAAPSEEQQPQQSQQPPAGGRGGRGGRGRGGIPLPGMGGGPPRGGGGPGGRGGARGGSSIADLQKRLAGAPLGGGHPPGGSMRLPGGPPPGGAGKASVSEIRGKINLPMGGFMPGGGAPSMAELKQRKMQREQEEQGGPPQEGQEQPAESKAEDGEKEVEEPTSSISGRAYVKEGWIRCFVWQHLILQLS